MHSKPKRWYLKRNKVYVSECKSVLSLKFTFSIIPYILLVKSNGCSSAVFKVLISVSQFCTFLTASSECIWRVPLHSITQYSGLQALITSNNNQMTENQFFINLIKLIASIATPQEEAALAFSHYHPPSLSVHHPFMPLSASSWTVLQTTELSFSALNNGIIPDEILDWLYCLISWSCK